jgi:Uma2 family endonuclease
MSAALVLPPVAEDYPRRKKFTRSEVYRMLELGLFDGQRFELIHGDVIDKMGQSARHSFGITELTALLSQRFGPRALRIQLPMEVHRSDSEFSEPEPDIVLLSADNPVYRNRHPRGEEAVLVVEVADTSIRGDLTVKRDLYARAGVPEYWVLDIASNKLTVHRNPSDGKYAEVVTLTASDSVPVPQRPGDSIALAGLFQQPT